MTTPQPDRIALYFEHFLPRHIVSIGLDKMDAFTTTFGFVIDDHPDGHWVFRFERGTLVETRRGQTPDADEAFRYHMNTDAFWDVVGGQSDPRTVFLEGRAEINGDTEQALKAGMILAQFTQKHPYPKDLAAGVIPGEVCDA